MTVEFRIPDRTYDRINKQMVSVGRKSAMALSRAVNRALTQGRTELTRSIREQYTVKAGAVRKAAIIRKMSPGGRGGSLVVSGPNLPISYFQYRPKSDTTGSRRRPVSARILARGASYQIRAGFSYNGTVFRRTGPERLPIERVVRMSVAGMAQNDKVVERVENKIQESLEKRMSHELERITK